MTECASERGGEQHAPAPRNGPVVAPQEPPPARDQRTDDDWDAELDPPLAPLSRADAERLFGPRVSRPSRVTPAKVVVAQVALTLISTLAWWLLSSRPGPAALSALLGGAIAWVPGGLFAWRLKLLGGRASAGSWVLGEAIKLGVTLAMFIGAAVAFPEVRWVPLLVTYLLALKMYWIALGLN